MKLLMIADIHYALRQFDWLVAVAADYDVVVIAGDLLEIAHSVDRRAQIVVVRTYLERLNALTRVIVCSGNHDLDTEGAHGERMAAWMEELQSLGVAADGGSLYFGDTLVTVCPWWDGPESKRDVARLLAEDAAKPAARRIWVYHAPPTGSPVSWGGNRHFGDPDLRGWITEHAPDIVLSGHVHQAPFISGGAWVDRVGESWVFNCGQQPGPEPAHIICDLDAGLAFWASISGTEQLRLNDPGAAPEPARDWPAWLRA